MSDVEKPELRRANDNPWYCLATMYGEQAANQKDFDAGLAVKNRLAWNRWIATALSDEERTNLVKNGFPEVELAPFSLEAKSEFCSTFTVRAGLENELPPEPAERPRFAFVHFDRIVDFGGFLFAQAPDFYSATFSRDAGFRSATFSDGAEFNSATFSDDAEFISATFSGDATFGSATFSSNAWFGSATFSESADFESAKFTGLADFSAATFSSNTLFTSATFFDGDFTSATFSDSAAFGSATFFGVARFNSVTFSDVATFAAATLSDYTGFRSATFSGVANFGAATFCGDIHFVNAKFAAETIFAKTDFRTHAPDLRGATMHEATEWHGAIWPKPPRDRDTAQTQVYTYERLKQEMERLKKHEDEQSFFRRELRARRGLTSPLSGAWLLNYLYELLSDYGQSPGRPLLWLFGVFAVGFSYFAVAPVFNSTRMTVGHAAMISFANIFSFLPITRDAIAGLSGVAKIIGAIQSILAALLLFLLSLALRNRFRMK